MSTDRDVTRIVRSWMDEGATQLPDRVLDAVLHQIPATQQRRPVRAAGRVFSMNPRFLFWAGVAAALAMIVFALAPRSNVGTHTKSPGPSTSPSALSQGLLADSLSPGTYRIDQLFPVPATFELSAGWSLNAEFGPGKVELSKPVRSGIDAAYLSFFVVSNAYADPCHTEDGPMAPPLGPSVDELVNVLTTPSGFHPGPISEVTVGGFRGKSFDLTNTLDPPLCSADASGNLSQFTYPGTDSDLKDVQRTVGVTGFQHQRFWILDVHGTRLTIVEWIFDLITPAEIAEMDQIVSSMRFE